jgi:hypothetical protein
MTMDTTRLPFWHKPGTPETVAEWIDLVRTNLTYRAGTYRDGDTLYIKTPESDTIYAVSIHETRP